MPNSQPRRFAGGFAPLAAFIGLLALLVWGRENWLYRFEITGVGFGSPNEVYLPQNQDVVGSIETPVGPLHHRQRLVFSGWVGSAQPKAEPGRLFLVSDGARIAEIHDLHPAPIGLVFDDRRFRTLGWFAALPAGTLAANRHFIELQRQDKSGSIWRLAYEVISVD